MSFMLGFLFNRWALLILVVVVMVALVGAQKLMWNRYTIGGMLLLVMGIGAWTIHDRWVVAERVRGEKIVRDEWNAETAVLKLAADLATAANKAKELAWANAATKAKNEADKRAKTLQANAAAARAESRGLRDDLATARSQMSGSTCDSVRAYAATASVVLDQCMGQYQEMASNAEGHASGIELMMSAWPK